jgi:alpha-soluble NSF attachment protein
MASFGDQKGRGNVFLSQAEKELQKFTFFSSSSKYENAAELLQKAGNCFKVSSSWQEAGDAYMKASELFTTKLSSSHEASAAMMDAGNCYKKVNPPQAINAFRGAIGLWTEAGRFNQAAKMLKEIAEMYEADKNAVEVSRR